MTASIVMQNFKAYNDFTSKILQTSKEGLIRTVIISSVFLYNDRSTRSLSTFSPTPPPFQDGMLVHRRATPSGTFCS